ncbi:ATP-binding protein [Streptomyces sp. SID8014]|nr:ATP-binding protein [Streptomyces sp. SID8014]
MVHVSGDSPPHHEGTRRPAAVLLRFQVTNHASIRDEQEISFIADTSAPHRVKTPVPGSTHHAVPVAAVYGPNASGKSNVLDALVWAGAAVHHSFAHWTPDQGVPRRPFSLRPDARTYPSTYELDFVVGGVRYTYGFEVDDARVREEWLFFYPEGSRRKLYERVTDDEGVSAMSFGRSLTGRRKVIADLLRPNSLYLSVAAAQGHALLGEVYRWFSTCLRSATDRDFRARLDYTVELYGADDSDGSASYRSSLRHLLSLADLGVSGLAISDPDEKEAHELRRIAGAVRGVVGDHVQVDATPSRRVQVEHRTEDGVHHLGLHEESSGTRTWIGLLGPIVTTLRDGTVLIVDELDARLHPHLADVLVGLFQSPEVNCRGAQLLFSTHEASLLGRNSRTELLRDQIWFTEKDSRTSGTLVFPMSDFQVRPDTMQNLEKRYLEGRFGALPHLDDDLLAELADSLHEPAGGGGAPHRSDEHRGTDGQGALTRQRQAQAAGAA